MNNKILSKLLEEPNAPLLMQEVYDCLSREHLERLEFRGNINEQKVEFINGEIVIHSPVKKGTTRLRFYLLNY